MLPDTATDTVMFGRIQTSDPHTDGKYVSRAGIGMWSDNSTNLVLTRNAVGDWSLNRTAAGAETYNCLACLDIHDRLPSGTAGAEQIDLGSQLVQPYDALGRNIVKGLLPTAVAVQYLVGVVPLTSAAFVLKRTRYQDGVAVSVTDLPLTGSFTGRLAVAATPYLTTFTVNTPTYPPGDSTILSAEFAFTMASTGTIRVYCMVFKYSYNFD